MALLACCTTAVGSARNTGPLGCQSDTRRCVPGASAQFAFQTANLLTQCRLRDEQPLRGAPEVELGGDANEIPKVPQLHTPRIGTSYRKPAIRRTSGSVRGRPPLRCSSIAARERHMRDMHTSVLRAAPCTLGARLADAGCCQVQRGTMSAASRAGRGQKGEFSGAPASMRRSGEEATGTGPHPPIAIAGMTPGSPNHMLAGEKGIYPR
jgi:hypothetical protein